ncbi:MAG: two component regulator propeller domain protein [Ignavibacteria bacterium]|nr:two component regulator propeller domain protein [Ignavibacteria bacterium]
MQKIFYYALVFLSSITLNYGQWKECKGPSHIAADIVVTSDNYIFVGTSRNGVYFSTNDGKNWNVPKLGNIKCIAIDGSNVLAGGNDYSSGIYTSTDYGYNWKKISNSKATCLAIKGSNIFIGSGGLFYSSDYGGTWEQITNPDMKEISCISIIENQVYVGSIYGIYISSDYGKSWREARKGLTSFIYKSIVKRGDYLYTGTYGGGVFLSTNDGNSWTPVNNGLGSLWINNVSVSGNCIFAATDSNGIYLSTNNGTDWKQANNGIYDLHATSLSVSNGKLYVGTGSGIYLSTNRGENWEIIGLTKFSASLLASNGQELFASNSSYLYMIKNDTNGWNVNICGTPMHYIECIAINENKIFIGNHDWGIFSSIDSGRNWTSINSGIVTYSVKNIIIDNNIIYELSDKVIGVSTDNGKSWFAISIDNCKSNLYSFFIKGNDFYVGTNSDGIFLSTNKGDNWNQINNGLPSIWFINNLKLIAGNIVANYYNYGLYRFNNNEARWEQIINSLKKESYSFSVSNEKIFIGTSKGMFVTTDLESTWFPINQGLTNLSIKTLAILGNIIFAGTQNGTFYANIDDFKNVLSIIDFTINPFKAYPNPAENIITFDLTLEKPERVTIELFDALGNKLAVVANDLYGAGNHTFLANLLPFSTGLLYYRVKIGDIVKSGIMTVIR